MKISENNKVQNDRVVAVTVTFNRALLLKKTLQALENQTYAVDKIIVVDNGSDKRNEKEIISQTAENPDIDVLWMGENLGGAGGFEKGMRYAAEKYNPHWYWVMDDDACPRPDTLEKLLSHKEINNVGCLAPLVWGVNWKKYQLYQHKKISRLHTVDKPMFKDVSEMRDVEPIDANAFVGPLFSREAVRDIGFPEGKLFIYGDDTEYTTRINRKYNIYLVRDAVIEHRDPPVTNEVFGPETYWKLYYTMRNRMLIARKYNKGFFRKLGGFFLLTGEALWQTVYSLFRKGLAEHRLLRIRCVMKGYWHGVIGRKGKTMDPVDFMKRLER